MAQYAVKTRDVDCSTSRKFKSLEGARKRFESMVGYSAENAIEEQFYERTERGEALPKFDEVKRLRAVSMFGTVVVFEKIGA